MHKNIGAAAIGRDKAISAICVEEFDPPTWHCSLNPIQRTASAPTPVGPQYDHCWRIERGKVSARPAASVTTGRGLLRRAFWGVRRDQENSTDSAEEGSAGRGRHNAIPLSPKRHGRDDPKEKNAGS